MKTTFLQKIAIVQFFLLLLLTVSARAQWPPCSLGSFEDSTWGGWGRQSVLRYVPGMYQYTLADFVNDNVVFNLPQSQHHVIVSDQNTDTYLPHVVSPDNGGNYAIELGDYKVNGNWSDKIFKTVTVTSPCLSFNYALVMGKHTSGGDIEPFFMFRVRDAMGLLIDSLTFVRVATPGDPFFTLTASGTIMIRDWTEQRINMAGLVGQTVTLEFITSDCGNSSHYGYAYIDNICFGECCNSCETLFWDSKNKNASLYVYESSTDSSCCFKFQNSWFSPEIFKCSPYGIRIYNYHTGKKITQYTSTTPLVGGTPFTANLDICINRKDFTGGEITLGFDYLDANGNIICTGKQKLQSCHSETCNCDTYVPFSFESALYAPIKDSSIAQCCYYVKYPPFKCDIYGVRIYHADSGITVPMYNFLDIMSSTPVSGQQIPSQNFRFCINQNLFNPDVPVRFEFLDATGRIICATQQDLTCEHACCDSMVVKVEPYDGCSGKIFFGIPSGSSHCGITKIKLPFAAMGDPRPGYSEGLMLPYTLQPGETRTYTSYFTNADGDTICYKSVTVSCNEDSCCQSMVAINEPAVAGGECSGNVFFGIPAGMQSCGIVSMKLSHVAMGDLRPGYSFGLSIPYCLTAGDIDTFTAWFVNSSGDTVCHKSIIVSCPGVSCCDAIKVGLKPHLTSPNDGTLPVACCYDYEFNVNPCYRCSNIYTIRVQGGNVLLQGINVMDSLPPLKTPALVRGTACTNASVPTYKWLELLDINGNVICTIPVEIPGCRAGNGDQRIGSSNNTDNEHQEHDLTRNPFIDFEVQPNPANAIVMVIFSSETTSDISLQLTDITGRVVEKRIVSYDQGRKQETFATGHLQSGIYFISISQSGNTQTQKLIIQH